MVLRVVTVSRPCDEHASEGVDGFGRVVDRRSILPAGPRELLSVFGNVKRAVEHPAVVVLESARQDAVEPQARRAHAHVVRRQIDADFDRSPLGTRSRLADALSGDPVLRFTENFYILGPQDPSTAPFTHFRHGGGVANVGYLDGHVEPKTEEFVASPASWDQAANNLRQQMKLGYISNSSVDAYRAE